MIYFFYIILSSNNMDNIYKEKYLKYKTKYFRLKNQYGGQLVQVPRDKIKDFHVFQDGDNNKLIILDQTNKRNPKILQIINSQGIILSFFLGNNIFKLNENNFKLSFELKRNGKKYDLDIVDGKVISKEFLDIFEKLRQVKMYTPEIDRERERQEKRIKDLELSMHKKEDELKKKDELKKEDELKKKDELKKEEISVMITPGSDLKKSSVKETKIFTSSKQYIEINDVIEDGTFLLKVLIYNYKKNNYGYGESDSHKFEKFINPIILSSKNIFAEKLGIPKNKFVLQADLLGKGSYGSVYNIVYNDSKFALKYSLVPTVPKIEKESSDDEINYTKLLSEMDVTAKFYGNLTYYDGKKYHVFLLSEAYDMNLMKYILWYRDRIKEESELLPKHLYHTFEKYIEKKIILKLKKMADLFIFCVDLKPQNIVINYDKTKWTRVNEVKLIDWGGNFCKNNNDLSSKEFKNRELLKVVIFDIMFMLLYLWFSNFEKITFGKEIKYIKQISKNLEEEDYRIYFAKLINFEKTITILNAYYIDNIFNFYTDRKDLLIKLFGDENYKKLLIEFKK
jgi:hypothetical protein